jgi:predicted DNA-binding transcriptional regulator AlpA
MELHEGKVIRVAETRKTRMATAEARARDVGRLLTSEDIALRYGVPEATVDAWAARKRGPRYVKAGRYRRYRLADLEAWEQANLSDARSA